MTGARLFLPFSLYSILYVHFKIPFFFNIACFIVLLSGVDQRRMGCPFESWSLLMFALRQFFLAIVTLGLLAEAWTRIFYQAALLKTCCKTSYTNKLDFWRQIHFTREVCVM